MQLALLDVGEQAHYHALLEAVEQILENERDYNDTCRYCRAEDRPYKDGEPMVVVDGNVEDADDWVIDQHEEWCPSNILGAIRNPKEQGDG